MNTKNNRNKNIISGLLSTVVLLAIVLGCKFGFDTNQAGTPTPANTPAATPTVKASKPDNSSDTAENPASAFYGKWEKKEEGQPFRYEIFGPASKKDDNYAGKVTDQRNVAVATYTVFNNKTVEIDYAEPYYNGESFTYPYTFSDGGNKLTLDANPPIVYTKGESNTKIEKDITFFTSGGVWKSSKDQNRELNFTNGQQEDKGWSGEFEITHPALPTEYGKFEVTEAGKMTLTPINGSSRAYTYKIRGELFDFTRDRDGDTDTFSH